MKDKVIEEFIEGLHQDEKKLEQLFEKLQTDAEKIRGNTIRCAEQLATIRKIKAQLQEALTEAASSRKPPKSRRSK